MEGGMEVTAISKLIALFLENKTQFRCLKKVQQKVHIFHIPRPKDFVTVIRTNVHVLG
jgi:hypothetical protein